MPSFVSVIMAGGSGTRFWPLSKKTLPKQYLSLFGDKTLIQQTVLRLQPLCPAENVYVCSGKSQSALLKEQVPDVADLILEPIAKNTSPCLMLTTSYLLKKGFPLSTVVVILPADHHVGNEEKFRSVLQTAIEFASSKDALVTIGITPTSPHTGYGYIEAGDKVDGQVLKAKRFVEKPNKQKAEEFLSSGRFFWNGGIFAWSLSSIVSAFEKYAKEDWDRIQSAKSEVELQSAFSQVKAEPIDIAVFEKAENVFVVPAAGIEWSDVGSWNALYELKNSSAENHVVLSGEVESFNSKGCLVKVDPKLKVALVGVEDLIVIESEGTLLISSRKNDQLVRSAAEKLDR